MTAESLTPAAWSISNSLRYFFNLACLDCTAASSTLTEYWKARPGNRDCEGGGGISNPTAFATCAATGDAAAAGSVGTSADDCGGMSGPAPVAMSIAADVPGTLESPASALGAARARHSGMSVSGWWVSLSS